MDYWYTATETYDKEHEDGSSWTKYIEFSKLTHLTELVSLDAILNGLVFEPDRGENGDCVSSWGLGLYYHRQPL
jgi:hypothetical protein